MNRLVLAALVLLAVVGAGGFNYHRNASSEQAKAPRLYRSYGDADLAALIEAYEHETEVAQARYDGTRSALRQGRGSVHLGDRVRDFERAQAQGRKSRGLTGELAQREAVLRELRREQELRERDPFQVHLGRLLTL